MANKETLALEFEFEIKDVDSLRSKFGNVQLARDAISYRIMERVADLVREVTVMDGAVVATLLRARSGADYDSTSG